MKAKVGGGRFEMKETSSAEEFVDVGNRCKFASGHGTGIARQRYLNEMQWIPFSKK